MAVNPLQKAMKLREKAIQKIQTNEYNLVTMNGVKCSRSDLEEIVMYCESFVTNNGMSWGNFMRPMGNTEKVLTKNGIEVQNNFGW